jgi:hypothetical protein
VSYGYTGPVTIDYTAATPGTWRVQVSCQSEGSTYVWETYAEYDGTNPVRDYTVNPIKAESGWSCGAYVGDSAVGQDATVWDVNNFTVGEPPVRLKSLGQYPAKFYPRVRDGYRDKTVTEYALNRSAAIKAKVLNGNGKKVRIDRLGAQSAGDHQWVWNGRIADGTKAPKGDYFIEMVATDADGHKDRFTTVVRVASKLVTRTDSVAVNGGSGAREATRSCTASRYDGVMTLDCWGGRYAQASYGFRIPKSAFKIKWHAAGQAPMADICCDGRITKTGTRPKARKFVVRVRVTGWRAYEVRSVSLGYKYKVRL